MEQRHWHRLYWGLTLAFIATMALITELTQRAWPTGPFPGRFDPNDIVAYGVGLAGVYLIEKLGSSSPHEVTDLGSRDTLPWSTK
jgi:predicted dienelactone hydrolase